MRKRLGVGVCLLACTLSACFAPSQRPAPKAEIPEELPPIVMPKPHSSGVPLPPGQQGVVSLFPEGGVPATIDMPPGGLPAYHPLPTTAKAAPKGKATLTGRVTPPEGGLTVLYQAPGLTTFAGGSTNPDGTFQIDVPVDGFQQGVLVAREPTESPRLALKRVSIRDGQAIAAGELALLEPEAAATPPTAPPHLQLGNAMLSAIEVGASPPWPVPLLSLSHPSLPTYNIARFSTVATYVAQTPDGQWGSMVAGEPGKAPPFLAPPEPGELPVKLAGGELLSWPAVPGATFYTARLTSALNPTPIWEGATPNTRLQLPAALKLGTEDLLLEVNAWDAPDVTIYSVANLRALRVPAQPPGARGRMSWLKLTYQGAGHARGPLPIPVPPEPSPEPEAPSEESPASQ